MTYGQPDIPQHSDYESKEFYLKEALRLSELKIKYQDDVFIAIERKIVLLITLYIAAIGYILSRWDIWDKDCYISTITILLIVILIFATLSGSFVLYPRRFEGAGAIPQYLMQEDFKHNFNKMATDLLNKGYVERLDINKKTLDTKIFFLRLSLWLGVVCIIIAFLIQVLTRFCT